MKKIATAFALMTSSAALAAMLSTIAQAQKVTLVCKYDRHIGQDGTVAASPVPAFGRIIDYGASTVDGNPAHITDRSIKWRTPRGSAGDTGDCFLDRITGGLTCSVYFGGRRDTVSEGSCRPSERRIP